MTQLCATTNSEEHPAPEPVKKMSALIQMIRMLGKGYFLITLVGILSFSLLFFILWFM